MFDKFFENLFGPRKQKKEPAHLSGFLACVDPVGKQILETLANEHKHSVTIEFVKADGGFVLGQLWMATAHVPKDQPYRIEWLKHELHRELGALMSEEQLVFPVTWAKMQTNLLSATGASPFEKPYEGEDPLLKWHPIQETAPEPPKATKDPEICFPRATLPLSWNAEIFENGT